MKTNDFKHLDVLTMTNYWQNIRTIETLKLQKQPVFVRLDLNVPQHDDGSISDETRLRAALPTLKYLSQQQCKVAVASHLGRPKGGDDRKFSLRPVAQRLENLLGAPVGFIDDCIGEKVMQALQKLPAGGFLLLENTRFYPEEEKNDAAFSAKLASGFSVYINDAFGTLHRAQASTAGMAAHFKEKAMGFLVQKELAALTPLMTQPKSPFVVILGGAKVSDKIGILRNLLPRLQHLLIGGGMAFTFLKAQGVEIGASLLDESKLKMVQEILDEAKRLKIGVHLPVDFRIVDAASTAPKAKVVASLKSGEKGLDIGPETVGAFSKILANAATVFWNGPLGVFEQPSFMEGTLGIARTVAGLKAHTVIGGGDTLAAFSELGLEERVTHASTGGGATLEFLEGRELPGLKALL
jgi:phosphoglycerate kinase